MGLQRRVFSKAFKEQVLLEIEGGKRLAQVAREHEIHPVMVCTWRRQREQDGEQAFAGNGRAYTEEARVAALERKIGQLTMENDLLKKCRRSDAGADPGRLGAGPCRARDAARPGAAFGSRRAVRQRRIHFPIAVQGGFASA